MIPVKQILELSNRCRTSTQYHNEVYGCIISSMIRTNPESLERKQLSIWLRGTYIPEDNVELQKLVNELRDDGFEATIEYERYRNRATYLKVSWK